MWRTTSRCTTDLDTEAMTDHATVAVWQCGGSGVAVMVNVTVISSSS